MARIVAGSGAAAALSLSMAGPAAPQGEARWSIHDGSSAPGIVALAQICPRLDMEVTGNFFCISLGCREGEPLGWRVDFIGAGEVPERVTVQFSADNSGLTPFEMRRADAGDAFGYAAPYDPERDAVIVAALAAGNTGLIAFDTPWLSPTTFSLVGAGEAMGLAIARCAAP